jgi:thioredoxin reductase (NADPH)
MNKYDLIIIGAGPAGLTAAIYAARYKLNVLVIGELAGGLAGKAYEIHNFPSYKKVNGSELMIKMVNQVKELGVEIKLEKVLDIKKKEEFIVATDKNRYFSKKIILSTGSERKKLNIDREKELIGKGVSYCATCDAGFYKNKIVGIFGGSNAALTSALLLSKFAKKVYIIYRKEKFYKTDSISREEVEKNKKIVLIFNSTITKLIGKEHLEEVELNNKKKLKVDGLFIEIGGLSSTELAGKLKIKLDSGNIVVDKKQKTNVKGVFAAGDVTNNPLKQIITACSEGAIAANTVYNELRK